MDGLYALAIIFVIYAVGQFISTKTNAIISMMFICAIIFAVAFWLGLPATIFEDAGFTAIADAAIGLILVHMGTVITLRDFLREWRAIVIVLATVLVIRIGVYFVGSIFLDQLDAFVGASVFSGGTVAYLIVYNAIVDIASTNTLLLASLVIIFQGLAGYPLASILCRKEALRLQQEIKAGNLVLDRGNDYDPAGQEEGKKKKLLPEVPEKYNSGYFILAKLALVACVAQWVSNLTGGSLNMLVLCLIFGIVAHELGFLEDNSLDKSNSYTLFMAAMFSYVFSSFAGTSPSDILSMIGPLLLVIVTGVVCCGVASILVGKLFKQSWYMSFAIGITSLIGFPATFIISTEVAEAVADNKEEEAILVQNIMPKMVISGMVAISIVSVLIAGFLTSFI